MKTHMKMFLALCAGVLGVTALFAADRMALAYGEGGTDPAVLKNAARGALDGRGGEAPAGVRVTLVEGSRALTAAHSPSSGERAYFLASGGGFSFAGFSLNGASVKFAVDGAEEGAIAKAAAIPTALPVYASTLTRVTAKSGVLRFDYSQKEAGRVSVEVLNMNGRILVRGAWAGEAGSHIQTLNVPGTSSRQVLLVRWQDGTYRQLKKVISQ